MGTNCATLVADLFLFCYERDFMLTLSDNNQAGVVYLKISRWLAYIIFSSEGFVSIYLSKIVNLNPWQDKMA